MKRYCSHLLLLWILVSRVAALDIVSSSFMGEPGDSVKALAIQPTGSIVVAANVSAGPLSVDAAGAVVAKLSPDGSRLLAKVGMGSQVNDMAMDGQGNIYVALADGVTKLDAQTLNILWKKDLRRVVNRIDAGNDGHSVALCYDKPESDTATGAGQMTVFDAHGQTVGGFKGQHFTIDCCLDTKNQTVVYAGFRNARAWEGKRVFPVQIAFVVGRSYTGQERYRLYDWPTKREDPGFLNKPTNNMADTRGYRCSIGEDGRLYVAFESAGGNHIFRWAPRLVNGEWVSAQSKKPKIDKYHAFYNSRAEHKTFIGCYDPSTGEYLRGQEFCARTSSGRANAVRVKHGAITATGEGIVLLTGSAAASLPVTISPPGTGDYQGGGFLLVLSPDLSERRECVRVLPGSEVTAVASLKQNGQHTIVVGGSLNTKTEEPFYLKHALQSQGKPGAGFLMVFHLEAGAEPASR